MRFTQSFGLTVLALCLSFADPFSAATANGQQTQDGGLRVAQMPPQGFRQRGSKRGRRGGGDSQQTALVVGQAAPSFALDSLDGESVTSLDQLRSEKPIVLFFGSYT